MVWLPADTEVTFKVTLPYVRPQEGEKHSFSKGISCLAGGHTRHNNWWQESIWIHNSTRSTQPEAKQNFLIFGEEKKLLLNK